MITQPTVSQLVDVVRHELKTTIAPSTTDPNLQGSLSMIDSILAAVATRSLHEVAWVLEEIAAIEAIADRVVAADVPGADRVAEALTELRSNRSSSLHVEDLIPDYDRAGEVLSRCIEATLPGGGELFDAVQELLTARTAREVAIRGEASLAGRG